MARNDKKKPFTLGNLIFILIALAIMEPALFGILLVLAIPAGICWILLRIFRKSGRSQRQHEHRTNRSTPLDDCPKPICFHKDKGVHHVRQGRGIDPWDLPNREIDPWDRPDIDIRKYQRR